MDPYLNALTTIIIANYFNDTNCIFLITDYKNGFDLRATIPIVNVKTTGTLPKNLFRNGYGCNGFVIRSETPCEIFRNVEFAMKHTDEKFNNRRYLVLPPSDDGTDTRCLFEADELKYVDDFLLVRPEEHHERLSLNETQETTSIVYQLWTHKYGGDVHNETVLLDKWYSSNESFLFDNVLYPDKLRNQHGRKLRVATFTYPPYAIPEIIDGSELRMTNFFAQLYNASTVLVIDEDGQWGTIHDNWTGIGVVGNVAIDEADIGLGALYTWQRESLFLDLSKNFVRTGITCLAPQPRLADGWLTPVLAFSNRLWMAVGVTLLMVILSLFFTTAIIRKYDLDERYSNKNASTLAIESIFKTLSIFFTQSVPNNQLPQNKLFNAIFGMVLIIGVLLTTCYSSGLSSNMTVPRYVGEVKTVKDLVESKLHWGATDFAWVASIANDSDPDISTLFHRFEILSEQKLNKNAQTNRFAFSMERLSGGNFAIGRYIGRKEIRSLKPMLEDIYFEHCVFMLRKSSILLPLLNDLILKIFEAGLLKNWEFDVVVKTMDTYVQRVVRSSFHHRTDSEPIELKLNHLAGGFGVLIVGLMLSFVMFLCEYFGHKI